MGQRTLPHDRQRMIAGLLPGFGAGFLKFFDDNRLDFTVFGMAAQLQLGEDQFTIHGHLKFATAGRDEVP